MTILEYINESYEEPYRAQIIEAIKIEKPATLDIDVAEIPTSRPAHFLGYLFLYSESKQGLKYWADYEKSLRDE